MRAIQRRARLVHVHLVETLWQHTGLRLDPIQGCIPESLLLLEGFFIIVYDVNSFRGVKSSGVTRNSELAGIRG